MSTVTEIHALWEYVKTLTTRIGNLLSPTDILTRIYPVGSVYISTVDVSPEEFAGGTWEAIKDAFLLMAGDIYAAGETGGSSEAFLVEHSHIPNTGDGTGFLSYSVGAVSRTKVATSSSGRYAVLGTSGATSASTSGLEFAEETTSAGILSAGNNANMPPYIAVYAWKRVA